MAPVEKKPARLVGTLEGKSFELPLGPKTSLGRHPANTVRLPDREVSKEHAVIEQRGEGVFVLRDLGSSNGTFVNGRRVTELQLSEGDEISVGNQRLLFRKSADPSPYAQTPVTVVGSALSLPAFLAQVPQVEDGEFRPADQIPDAVQLRQDYEKLRVGHEFQRQMGRARDENTLFQRILGAAFQLMTADNGVLFAVEDGGFRTAAVKRRGGDRSEVVVSDTVLQRVVETRQGVLTADAIVDARFSASESLVAQGIRSAMAVPLITQGKVRAILFLDSRVRANAFSEKDLRILSTIAAQAAIALENTDLVRRIEAEAVTRAELSRFLSPAIAEMVVQGQVDMLRQGRLVDVSVLFADIRGFTTMSERETPQTLVTMLNDFFSAMSAVVFRHEGNLDKFIGDCVMAVWGPPSAHEDDPGRALRAALEMQEAVVLLNALREAAGKPPIEVGIGVNTGPAVVGYMGSVDRHEYTAIGDSVNTASRLCGLAQGGEVLATDATVTRAGTGFEVEPLSRASLKGKDKPVQVYRVTGVETTDGGRKR
ncbi:MAG: adenylate/guanylate cyclase domain-containing protein [Myxococcaceae bacterium]